MREWHGILYPVSRQTNHALNYEKNRYSVAGGPCVRGIRIPCAGHPHHSQGGSEPFEPVARRRQHDRRAECRRLAGNPPHREVRHRAGCPLLDAGDEDRLRENPPRLHQHPRLCEVLRAGRAECLRRSAGGLQRARQERRRAWEGSGPNGRMRRGKQREKSLFTVSASGRTRCAHRRNARRRRP